ncbi:MAG: Na+/H+ antiporter subunit E [Nocardioidaceae bacterium]
MPGPRRVIGFGVRFGLWFAFVFGLYLLLISSITPAELVAGAVLATGSAAVAVLAGTAFHVDPRPPRGSARWLVAVPGEIARGSAALAGLLWSTLLHPGKAHGRFTEAMLSSDEPGDHASRRAYAVMILSLSPGSFVVHLDRVDERRDRLRLHQIGSGGSLETVVTR